MINAASSGEPIVLSCSSGKNRRSHMSLLN